MSFSKLRPGFTVLELLIVIALLGLVATLAGLSVNSARARMRDAQRLSDVSLLRSGLSVYFTEQANYPASTGVDLGRPGTSTDRLSAPGFVASDNAATPVYIPRVPISPTANEFYRYRGDSSGYSVRFRLESKSEFGLPGIYYAHTSVIDKLDELK